MVAILALAACAPAAAPTLVPTASPSPAVTMSPTAGPAATPAPSPDGSPAGTIGRVPASPSVDRQAADIGSRVCVVNQTAVWIEAARRDQVVDPRSPRPQPGIDPAQIRPGDSWCTEGRWACSLDTGTEVDVCGFVTIPGGRVVAFQALRWLGESLFAFDDDAGSNAEDSWTVGERQSIVTGGYTVTGERLADSPSSVVFNLAIAG